MDPHSRKTHRPIEAVDLNHNAAEFSPPGRVRRKRASTSASDGASPAARAAIPARAWAWALLTRARAWGLRTVRSLGRRAALSLVPTLAMALLLLASPTAFAQAGSEQVSSQSATLTDGLQVSIRSYSSFVSDASEALFQVEVNEAPDRDLEINLKVSGAYFGDDAGGDWTVTIPAGRTFAQWSPQQVRTPHPLIPLPMVVTVANGDGYEVGLNSHAVTTLESGGGASDRARVSFSASADQVTEGGEATFTFTLDPPRPWSIGFQVRLTTVGSLVDGANPSVSSHLVEFAANKTEATLTVSVREGDDLFQGNETVMVEYDHTCDGCARYVADVVADERSAVAAVTVRDDERVPTGIALSVSPGKVQDDDGKTRFVVKAELLGDAPLATTTKIDIGLSDVGWPAGAALTPQPFVITVDAGKRVASGTVWLTPAESNGSHQKDGTVTITGAHSWLRVDAATVRVLNTFPFSLVVEGGVGLTLVPDTTDGVTRFTATEGHRMTLTATASDSYSGSITWSWSQSGEDAVQVLEGTHSTATGTGALVLDLPVHHEDYALMFTVTAEDGDGDIATAVVSIDVANLDGICDRTPAVRRAILSHLPPGTGCAGVTPAHLRQINGTLILNNASLNTLLLHDFAGLVSIRTLLLRDNGLKSLPAGVFSDLTSLTSLNLSGNQLLSLLPGVFSGLSSIETIRMSGNGPLSLPDGVFAGLTSLTTLDLSGNQLASLPEGLFSGLTALVSLNLRDNRLTSLSSGLFASLALVESINLYGNHLTELPSDLLSGLEGLSNLSLSFNRLESISESLLSNLDALEHLHLNDNRLSELPPGAFSDLSSLRNLILSNNRLSSLPPGIFDGLNLTDLALYSNRFDELPEGVFTGLVGLGSFRFDPNPLDAAGDRTGAKEHSFTVELEAVDDTRGVRVRIAQGVPAATVLALKVGSERHDIEIPVGADQVEWMSPEPRSGVTVTLEAGEVGQPAERATGIDFAFEAQTIVLLKRVGISIAAPESSVSEGGMVEFVVTANPPPTEARAIMVSLSGGAAFGVPDGRRRVALARGAPTSTLSVPTRDDEIARSPQIVQASLLDGAGYHLSATTTTHVTILDDDIEVSIAASSPVVEAGKAVTFTVRASSAPPTPRLVQVALSVEGDFEVGDTTRTVEFTAATSTATFTVEVTGVPDRIGDGVLTARVRPGGDYEAGAPSSARVSIAHTEPRISLSGVSPSKVREGEAVMFTLKVGPGTLSVPRRVNVTLAVDGDFEVGELSRTVEFPSGTSTATFVVEVEDDASVEPDGTLTARVESGFGYRVGPENSLTTMIEDDDLRISIESSRSWVEAVLSPVEFVVRASEAPMETVIVNVTLSNEPVLVGPGSRKVRIEAGKTTATLSVETNPKGAGMDNVITATIQDGTGYVPGVPANSAVLVAAVLVPDLFLDSWIRKLLPAVSIAPVAFEAMEGRDAEFVLTMSQTSTSALSIKVGTAGDGAKSLEAGSRQEVEIAAGATTTTITVSTRTDDKHWQGSGVLTATVLTGTGYVRGAPPVAFVMVEDDERAPSRIALSMSPSEVEESATTTTVTVTARLEGGDPFARQMEVELTLSGAGRSGLVFTPERFALSLAAGATTATGTFVLTPGLDEDEYGGMGTVTVRGAHASLPVDAATLRVRDTFQPDVSVTGSASLAQVLPAAAGASAKDDTSSSGSPSSDKFAFMAREGARVTLTATSPGFASPGEFVWTQHVGDTVRVLANGVTTDAPALRLTLPQRSASYTAHLEVAVTHAMGDGTAPRTASVPVTITVSAEDNPPRIHEAVAVVSGVVADSNPVPVLPGASVTLRGVASDPDSEQHFTTRWLDPEGVTLTPSNGITPMEAVIAAPREDGEHTYTFRADDGGEHNLPDSPQVTLSVSSQPGIWIRPLTLEVKENEGSAARFELRLSATSTASFTVQVSLFGAEDFGVSSRTEQVEFGAKASTAILTVDIDDNDEYQPDATLTARVGSAEGGYRPVAPLYAEVAVINDEVAPVPDINADDRVDASDALILYYAFSMRSTLGQGR